MSRSYGRAEEGMWASMNLGDAGECCPDCGAARHDGPCGNGNATIEALPWWRRWWHKVRLPPVIQEMISRQFQASAPVSREATDEPISLLSQEVAQLCTKYGYSLDSAFWQDLDALIAAAAPVSHPSPQWVETGAAGYVYCRCGTSQDRRNVKCSTCGALNPFAAVSPPQQQEARRAHLLRSGLIHLRHRIEGNIDAPHYRHYHLEVIDAALRLLVRMSKGDIYV